MSSTEKKKHMQKLWMKNASIFYRTVRLRIIHCEKEGCKSLREKADNLVLTSLKRRTGK